MMTTMTAEEQTMERSPKRISRRARRKQILEVAARMIEQEGFEAISARKLAQEAEISDTLIFRHFNTMNDLFKEICHTSITDITSVALDPNMNDDHVFIEELAYRILEQNRENPRSLRLLTWAELQLPEIVSGIRRHLLKSGPFLELQYRLQEYVDDERQMDIFVRIFFNSLISELKQNLVYDRGRTILNSRYYAKNLTHFLTYGLMMKL